MDHKYFRANNWRWGVSILLLLIVALLCKELLSDPSLQSSELTFEVAAFILIVLLPVGLFQLFLSFRNYFKLTDEGIIVRKGFRTIYIPWQELQFQGARNGTELFLDSPTLLTLILGIDSIFIVRNKETGEEMRISAVDFNRTKEIWKVLTGRKEI